MAAPDHSLDTARSSGPRGRRIQGLDAEERRARRRAQLLDAAFELIARDGFAGTSIEQIAQTAYVGNKAFYEQFASKEDCYLALLQLISERIQDHVAGALAEVGPGDDAPAAVIAAFAHALVDDPRVAAVTFGEASGISPRVEAQRRANRRWAAEFLENLWRREGIVAGDPGFDTRALAVSTVGGLFDTVADWLHHTPAREEDIDSLVTDLTTFARVVHAGIAALAR
ncbi:TetR/AcrR family transcriptional regulator [Nocardia thailandica]|uniref:TetR/AcrR family transcriptional regulator n=1 Tax=Nocardia thailandica TaxID=257275 RepID=A0ABW6PMR9_9NOCA|nr:TetR/AcrR family transcriptional regulator [Nocardia thailandica]